MIQTTNLVQIGTLRKPHGTKGEVQMFLMRDFPEEAEYLMLFIDNIPVPFYLEEWRYKTDDILLLKFEDVDSEQAAKRIIGCSVFVEKDRYSIESDDEMSIHSLVGYTVIEQERGILGIVTAIDDTTINTLLLLDNDIVLPFHTDFVLSVDSDNRQLLMSLPQGL